MATRALFNHTDVPVEQNLVEDLIIESIQIYGLDLYYLPKNTAKLDDLFGEDAGTTKYDQAYPIEMYIKNVEGFEGEGNFLQQFGMQIDDQVTFTVARKRFDELSTGLVRPEAGDLIYFGLTNSMFEINFVEDESIFYQMGKIFVFDLQCQMFEFSDQLFRTGIEEIDAYGLAIASGTNIVLYSGVGTYTIGEYVYQGTSLEDANMTAVVKDFSVSGISQSGEPEIELISMSDQPASGVPIIGDESGASWTTVLSAIAIDENEMEEVKGDNWIIEQEADEWIDFSENNPFGNF